MSDPHVKVENQLACDVRRVMLPLYDRLQGFAPPPPAGQSISCSKGCGACCWQSFPIPLIDAVTIVYELRETPGGRAKLYEILDRCAEQEKTLRFVYGTRGYLTLREPCVLFEREVRGVPLPEDYRGGCSVYAVRPVVCRTYFVTSPPDRCRPGQEHGRTVFGLAPINMQIRAKLEELLDPWVFLPLPIPVGIRWAATLLRDEQLEQADVDFWQARTALAEEVRARAFEKTWAGPALEGKAP